MWKCHVIKRVAWNIKLALGVEDHNHALKQEVGFWVKRKRHPRLRRTGQNLSPSVHPKPQNGRKWQFLGKSSVPAHAITSSAHWPLLNAQVGVDAGVAGSAGEVFVFSVRYVLPCSVVSVFFGQTEVDEEQLGEKQTNAYALGKHDSQLKHYSSGFMSDLPTFLVVLWKKKKKGAQLAHGWVGNTLPV